MFPMSLPSSRRAYGDSPFGRGCLAARRLIEVGVRCVEVTLDGWDTHTNNHEGCQKLKHQLDPAFAALIHDLKQREMWDKTLILCAGEFGRTPIINRLDGAITGRMDLAQHWPVEGSAVARPLARPIRREAKSLESPRRVADVHATMLTALGIDPLTENVAPVGRPIKLSDGAAIKELLIDA